MDVDEIKEAAERAQEGGQRGVGVTMSIVAVLLAVTTMLGHRTHTEEVVLQTRAADQWAYYQAKNNRAQMYAANAQLAALLGEKGADTSAEFRKVAEEQKNGAEELRSDAEKIERETQEAAHQATYFDISEVLFEVSIVLASITLLTRSLSFWKMSIISAALGVTMTAIALFR